MADILASDNSCTPTLMNVQGNVNVTCNEQESQIQNKQQNPIEVGKETTINIYSTGYCSPVVFQVSGNVTITCEGVDPKHLEKLNQQLADKNWALERKIEEAEQFRQAHMYVKRQLDLLKNDYQSLYDQLKTAYDATDYSEIHIIIGEILKNGYEKNKSINELIEIKSDKKEDKPIGDLFRHFVDSTESYESMEFLLIKLDGFLYALENNYSQARRRFEYNPFYGFEGNIRNLVDRAFIYKSIGKYIIESNYISEIFYNDALLRIDEYSGSETGKLELKFQILIELGEARVSNKKINAAISAFTAALEITTKIYGPEHPLTHNVLTNLRNVLK